MVFNIYSLFNLISNICQQTTKQCFKHWLTNYNSQILFCIHKHRQMMKKQNLSTHKNKSPNISSSQANLIPIQRYIISNNYSNHQSSKQEMYQIRTNNLLSTHKKLPNSRADGFDMTSCSPSNISEPKLKQIEQIFNKQNDNLKKHRDFLIAEVRKSNQRVNRYKNKAKDLKKVISQLKQQNSVLKNQNYQLNQYVLKIINQMEVLLSHKIEEIELSSNSTIKNTQPNYFHQNKFPLESSENQTQSLNYFYSNQTKQSQINLNSNNNKLFQSQRQKEHTLNKNILDQLNDKFQALMYQYIQTKDSNIRKQSIDLAKQIKKIKMNINVKVEDPQQTREQQNEEVNAQMVKLFSKTQELHKPTKVSKNTSIEKNGSFMEISTPRNKGLPPKYSNNYLLSHASAQKNKIQVQNCKSSQQSLNSYFKKKPPMKKSHNKHQMDNNSLNQPISKKKNI